MSDYVPDTTARELPRLPRMDVDIDDSSEWSVDENDPTSTLSTELLDAARGEKTDVQPTQHRGLPGISLDPGTTREKAERMTLPGTSRGTPGLKRPAAPPPAPPPPIPAPAAPLPPAQPGVPGALAPTATPIPFGNLRDRLSLRVPPQAPAPQPPAPAPPPQRPVTGQQPPVVRPATGQQPPVAPTPPTSSTTPGRLVGGRYQILERIGQGGMGKVFKVSHHQLGKVFALKIISEQMAETDEARELFFREAKLASSLSHSNITSVVDFGEDDELGMFMVMELVEGEPLAKLLHRERQLGVRVASEVILQVAEALHYIHSKNIVHCDIKTENILIGEVAGTKRRNMQVKLLDFGLARSMSASRTTSSLSGTPHYVAPERIRGESPSPSSDIYGLGILLYELLTGKVPWDGHVAQILTGHLELAPTPPSQLIEGGLDPALENLILHALAKKPAERHRDMAAFIYELRTVMDMLGFGRRGKRGGARRVVIERSKNERDALVRQVFEGCRLPLALITTNGLIVVANPSFAKFVMGVAVDIEGLTVQSTPLAGCWNTFETDLARATSGQSVRRVLEMDVDGSGREVRRLLMWLDPSSGDHVVLGVQPLEL